MRIGGVELSALLYHKSKINFELLLQVWSVLSKRTSVETVVALLNCT